MLCTWFWRTQLTLLTNPLREACLVISSKEAEPLTSSIEGPFQGETATDSIGAILHKDPDFTRLPSGTPARVRRVLERCLVKDQRRRLVG